MDSGPYNVVSATHPGGSGTEPPVIQDSGSTQEDDEAQYRLSSPGAVPISPHDEPYSGEIQCLAPPNHNIAHAGTSDRNLYKPTPH
jgi:hypothetical protein